MILAGKVVIHASIRNTAGVSVARDLFGTVSKDRATGRYGGSIRPQKVYGRYLEKWKRGSRGSPAAVGCLA